MQPPCEATLLRIVLGDDHVFGHHALYEEIVLKAHAKGMAGATVVRGLMGYGPATQHVEPLIPLGGRPVIIEIIDTEPRIRDFLPSIQSMLEGSLLTLQKVSVLS